MNLFHHLKLFIISLLLLFQFQHNGVSAAGLCRRENNDDYKCGSHTGDLPIWLATCTNNKCCCNVENGWNDGSTYQSNSCDNQSSVNIGCFACSGKRACQYVTNTDVGDSSCTGEKACEFFGPAMIGINSCRGKLACSYADGTIGDNSCNSEETCGYANGVTIGDGSCNSNSAVSACYDADGTTIGDGSCNFAQACYDADGSTIGDNSCNESSACRDADGTTIGYGSCNSDFACGEIDDVTIGHGSCNVDNACAEANGSTIGDNSCNAEGVCWGCEAGSVVPDGTCNDLNNVDEVGTRTTAWFGSQTTACRACFAQLRQGDYAVEVSASSSSARRTLRAMAESNSHCSILAQEMKEHVVESLSSHKRFVRFLEDKDLSKKCRKEYLSNAVGVIHDEGIFDNGCKLTIKVNAKLELLKEDEPDFETSFKEAVGDGLVPMDNIVVDEVMATKMNCEGSSPGPGGKSKKGKSTKSKGGKRGKK